MESKMWTEVPKLGNGCLAKNAQNGLPTPSNYPKPHFEQKCSKFDKLYTIIIVA
jgi:hypothetical protein